MSEDERKLFVGKLPQDIHEDEIRMIFNTYGRTSDVHLMSQNQQQPGQDRCAFVTYETTEAAKVAQQVLNGVYKFREDAEEPINVGPAFRRGGKGDKGKGRNDGYGRNDRGKGDYDRGPPPRGGYDRGPPAGYDRAPPMDRGYDRGYEQPSFDRGFDRGYDRGNDRGYEKPGYDRGGKGGYRDNGPYERFDRGGGKGAPYNRGKGPDFDRGFDRSYDRGCGGGYDRGPPPREYDRGPPPREVDAGKGGKQSSGGGCKLYIGNLPADITKDAVDMVFGTYGRVVDIHIMNARAKNGQSCAFVVYTNSTEAKTCMAAMQQGYEIRPGEGNIFVKHADEAKGEKGFRDRGPY
eukprot:CAMPEP_0172724088 /NCGR_PEP_ID=MMETSP1074-20121228/85140_1 /TAXON_ID=2916 /ORGANISM="Ceratium fusus, Strain PA161109" /LENGTH=348 /DNA_ID=CAMNT_0013550451 /DNA_START=81 /DNA_END=1127 /DNA_ORIENTATION=+